MRLWGVSFDPLLAAILLELSVGTLAYLQAQRHRLSGPTRSKLRGVKTEVNHMGHVALALSATPLFLHLPWLEIIGLFVPGESWPNVTRVSGIPAGQTLTNVDKCLYEKLPSVS